MFYIPYRFIMPTFFTSFSAFSHSLPTSWPIYIRPNMPHRFIGLLSMIYFHLFIIAYKYVIGIKSEWPSICLYFSFFPVPLLPVLSSNDIPYHFNVSIHRSTFRFYLITVWSLLCLLPLVPGGGGTELWVGYGCAARSFDHHPITKPRRKFATYI